MRKLILIFFCIINIINYTIGKRACINVETKRLTKSLKDKGFIHSKMIAKCMCEVDRKEFLKETKKSDAYLDMPVYIGYGATISAPHMHAYALETFIEKLENKNRNETIKFLDVGSGSGYLLVAFAKLLDNLGFKNYLLFGIDHIEELVEFSKNNINKSNSKLFENDKLKIVVGDGRLGLKEFSPFDFIHVGATSNTKPTPLIQQLNRGGRLFVPIKENNREEFIFIFDKQIDSDELKIQKTLAVNYIPLTDKLLQYESRNMFDL